MRRLIFSDGTCRGERWGDGLEADGDGGDGKSGKDVVKFGVVGGKNLVAEGGEGESKLYLNSLQTTLAETAPGVAGTGNPILSAGNASQSLSMSDSSVFFAMMLVAALLAFAMLTRLNNAVRIRFAQSVNAVVSRSSVSSDENNADAEQGETAVEYQIMD